MFQNFFDVKIWMPKIFDTKIFLMPKLFDAKIFCSKIFWCHKYFFFGRRGAGQEEGSSEKKSFSTRQRSFFFSCCLFSRLSLNIFCVLLLVTDGGTTHTHTQKKMFLFFVHTVVALLMLIGYKPRFVCVANFLLTIGLHGFLFLKKKKAKKKKITKKISRILFFFFCENQRICYVFLFLK